MPRTPEPVEPSALSPAVFHILLSLADEDRHGYGVMQEVEQRTRGRVRLGPGTLYGALKRLREDGWVEELDSEEGGERRRMYRLTSAGRKLARQEAQRLEELVVTAHAKRLLTSARWA
jgi:DNA-binding PadR family transcriptional regulator